MQTKIKQAAISSSKSLLKLTPMLLAIIALVGLFKVFITPEMLKTLFQGAPFYDTFIGVLTGGVSVGQPFLSYIIGGELLKEGVSYYAVVAFILSYVTLGVVQLPMEFSVFGLKFTLAKNLLSFLFAFIVSAVSVLTLQALQNFN